MLFRSTTANGHAFTIFDENGQPVPDASLWLGGRTYTSTDQRPILVPFSTAPARSPIVLTRGDFSCLDFFQHEAETYSLSAGIHVDRESLITRRTAKVLVRPGLFLNNAGQRVNPAQSVINNDAYSKQSHELRISSPQENRLRGMLGFFHQKQKHDFEQWFGNVAGLSDAMSLNQDEPNGKKFPGVVYLNSMDQIGRAHV